MTQRKIVELSVQPSPGQLLNWGNRFDYCMLLDSNPGSSGPKDPFSKFDYCLAAGAISCFTIKSAAFERLYDFQQSRNDWLFGHLSYDLKNQYHKTVSKHPDPIGFVDIHFFQPRYLILCKEEKCQLLYHPDYDDPESISAVEQKLATIAPVAASNSTGIDLTQRVSAKEYLDTAHRFLEHIQQGDIYEANYCVEFFAEHAIIDPPGLYTKLKNISSMPQSAYYRLKDRYLLCASPERFLAKRGQKLISQPIKGTVRRGNDATEDVALSAQLKSDAKELAENIMITDLVRNDLSITAQRGSVKVDELAALKTFPKIHQLVTTVSAHLDQRFTWADALKHAFPMGSMTGAPKLRAMEIIEALEATKRGLYSGCVGYISPEGDMDFNVVIRSIQYRQSNQFLSVMAGSALTAGCSPEAEYQECLLKTATMRQALA